jgi:hypothetical protein
LPAQSVGTIREQLLFLSALSGLDSQLGIPEHAP